MIAMVTTLRKRAFLDAKTHELLILAKPAGLDEKRGAAARAYRRGLEKGMLRDKDRTAIIRGLLDQGYVHFVQSGPGFLRLCR